MEDMVKIKECFGGIFKDKKVLITGHTGFKGSWLSIWLHELGAKVIGYGLEPYTERDNFALCKMNEKMISIIGDIRDDQKLLKVFTEFQPDFAFHLAAQPLVLYSYKMPKETYDVNIGGTVNFFEAVRKTDSVKVAMNVTSDKCYENKEYVWGYREIDPMGGYDPYSSSKGCSELITNAYRNSFFHPQKNHGKVKGIASVRAGNVIGGGDWSKDRIIPDCIRALEKKEAIQIRNPLATRPWQHVLEPLSGYLCLALKLYEEPENFSSAWNFGPNIDSVVSVKEIVKAVIESWGEGSWIDLSNSDNKAHEACLLSLDCSKVRNYLLWTPTLELKDGIDLTMEWYKEYRTKDVYNLCMHQIQEYTNKSRGKFLKKGIEGNPAYETNS